jgi:hypothetical protein
MLKGIGLLSAAVLSLTVGANQAGGSHYGTIAYLTTYYDDASYSTVVGYLRPRCDSGGTVTYTMSGSSSAYSVEEELYVCGPNGPETRDHD